MKGLALARGGSVTMGLTSIEQEDQRDEVLGQDVLLPGVIFPGEKTGNFHHRLIETVSVCQGGTRSDHGAGTTQTSNGHKKKQAKIQQNTIPKLY